MSSQEHKALIWDLIKQVKVGMLTTHVNNTLHARPMHIVQDEYDNRLWFFTDLNSEKVQETLAENDVCLVFSHPGKDIYVSLTGKASISQDKELIDKFWNPFVAAWFPDGKEADNVGLIEVKISAGEHWETASGKLMQLAEIAKANFTNETPDLGDNKKFGYVG